MTSKSRRLCASRLQSKRSSSRTRWRVATISEIKRSPRVARRIAHFHTPVSTSTGTQCWWSDHHRVSSGEWRVASADLRSSIKGPVTWPQHDAHPDYCLKKGPAHQQYENREANSERRRYPVQKAAPSHPQHGRKNHANEKKPEGISGPPMHSVK